MSRLFPRRHGSHRRGVAVLIVMLLISVALAVSYVSLRSQTMALQIHSNAGLRANAHEVALTGMAMALQKMQMYDWAGVSTTFSRSLGEGRRFEATYTTGDESLQAGAADYAEYPFRVTVDVTGYVSNPGQSAHEVSHRLRSVVRLVPRALGTEPTGWWDKDTKADTITNYTLCQWTQGDFSMTVPFRITGPVRVRATMDLCDNYLDWPNDVRSKYLEGLRTLANNGADWRPFNKSVSWTASAQTSENLLTQTLGVPTLEKPMATSVSWPSGSLAAGYRLYPGGKLYSAPTLCSELRNVTLGPDPKTNPLGAYYRAGCVKVYENVKVQGLVFVTGSTDADVEFYGAGAQFTPVELPALQGADVTSTDPVRLPTIFAADDVKFFSGSRAQINGLVVAIDRFLVGEANYGDMSLAILGKVATRNVQIQRRSEWGLNSAWWSLLLNLFWTQYNDPLGYRDFPLYLQSLGFGIQPRLAIREEEGFRYHWQSPNNPIYVPHVNDATTRDPCHPGLRWELVKWMDVPQT